MHTTCFWSECNQCNNSGREHQFKSNPYQQYPLHSPNITLVEVLEEHLLKSNLHKEDPIQDSNILLDGDKLHPPVIINTGFMTQDGVIQTSGNTSLGSQISTHSNGGIKDNQHQCNNKIEHKCNAKE